MEAGAVKWRRRRATPASQDRYPTTGDRPATRADVQHLAQFAEQHPGVEAYLEPPTAMTGTTVVLVAPSGQWTRRRIGDAGRARSFARKRAVPLYDVTVTGYPARMRAWSESRRADVGARPPGLRLPSHPER